MLFGEGALGLVVLGLWIFCIIDVITTPEDSVRNLPKTLWLIIVILLFDVGCIIWLVAGRNWNSQGPNLAYKGRRDYGPPAGAARQKPRATNPDDDEEFLAGLRARAEEQRRRARDSDGGAAGPDSPVDPA